MFSQNDLFQIQNKGITIDQIKDQLNTFQKGFPFLDVIKPAFCNDGILSLTSSQVKDLGVFYNSRKKNHSISKFIPASGAATRMFKSLYEYSDNPEIASNEADKFISSIKSFAFSSDLQSKAVERGLSLELMHTKQIIDLLLASDGLNYGNLPKGLIKFHSYKNGNRVAIEEHLIEGAMYAVTSNNEVLCHFTLSPEHILPFNNLIKNTIYNYEKQFSVKFHISYSIQKPATDTLAVNHHNHPFREKDGSLVFRPGGHGALLENLNEINADIIFIKNIDNVVPDRLKPETVDYKKALAGLLLQLQQQVSQYLNTDIPENEIEDIKAFIEANLGYKFPDTFNNLSFENKRNQIFQILNRPLRVCGMVKNSGEPGGGPYWVKGKDGSLSLQILETSQFNLDDETQRSIFKKATHFNPVDLIIYTKDYKGNKFNLTGFTNPETGFISIKSKDGKELKALELPGLWNGSMANWNTIFVEVPLITFNPVKTVNDLLRKEHQA
jgi:hypothetical protein